MRALPRRFRCHRCGHRWTRKGREAIPRKCANRHCQSELWWLRTGAKERPATTAAQLLNRVHQLHGMVRLRIAFEVSNPDYAAGEGKVKRLPGTAISLRLRSPDVAQALQSKIVELVTHLERTGRFPTLG